MGGCCTPSFGSGSQHESNNTNNGLMWCREEICRNSSMRFLKPAASSCHSKSCRKTRMVFIPMSSAQPSSLSICAASKLWACHISSWLIASSGIELLPTSHGCCSYHALALSAVQRDVCAGRKLESAMTMEVMKITCQHFFDLETIVSPRSEER